MTVAPQPARASKAPVAWTRWVTLVAGLFAMLCAGPVFTFGAVHSDIKNLLGASELEVQLIGVAGDIGLWLKVLPGIVFDVCGARATMVSGAAITCLGYVLMYVALGSGWPAAAAAMAWFFAGIGSGFLYTSALFASMKNFAAEDRGVVTGVAACVFGTSAVVLSSLLGGCLGGRIEEGGSCVGGALGGSVTSYVAMLAVVVPTIGMLAAAATRVRECGPGAGPDDQPRARLAAISAYLMVLLLVVFGLKTCQAVADPSVKTWANWPILALLPLLLLATIGARPTASTGSELARPRGEMSGDIAGQPAVAPKPTPRAEAAGALVEGPVVCIPLFWSLFLVFGISVGVALTTLNVLSAIVASRGLSHELPSLLLVVQMGADTSARLLSGAAVWAGRVRVTHLLVAAPVLGLAGQVLLALGGEPSLFVACALLGLCDGIAWMSAPLFVGQTFGLAKVGFNFGLTTLAAALFQSLFSLGIEPYFYRRHASAGGEHSCLGEACFTATHWILAAFSVFAVLAALFLHLDVARRQRGAAKQTVDSSPCSENCASDTSGESS